MIIDFHLHLGKGEPAASPLQRNLLPQSLIQIMDEAGEDKGIVFPVTYGDYWAANQELKGYVDRFPERLILFGRVGNTADAAENGRMIRCAEKCGFRTEGVLREARYSERDGKYHDNVIMGVLASDVLSET